MEGSLVVLMAVVVLVVVAVFPPIRSSKDRQRSQRLVAFAQSKGWHYDHERPELVDRFKGAPFVEGRSNARARHVLCTQMRGHSEPFSSCFSELKHEHGTSDLAGAVGAAA